MRFASLGSGSSGNSTLVCAGSTNILVDCGFGLKETVRRLEKLKVLPEQIDAILVTHEHSDHIKGVGAFSRRYSTPVYMTHGTLVARDYGQLPRLSLIDDYTPFTVNDIEITPVAVPHDAREPAQYIFGGADVRLGVLTDLGYITPHIINAYQGCDALLLEANHCSEMLAYGSYPPSLKSRVGGNWGHLNNHQALEFLQNFDVSQLRCLVLGHISRQNNSVKKVVEALEPIQQEIAHLDVIYACQDDGFHWQEIGSQNETTQSAMLQA